MAKVKTPEEIEKMKRGGALLAKALKAAVAAVKPGVMISELNAIVNREFAAGGGTPSFLHFKTLEDQGGFPSTLCVSIDDEVVHGLGNRNRKLEVGEIVGLDIGVWFEGLATDMAVTVPVGEVSTEKKLLMERAYESLRQGLARVKAGASIRGVGKTISEYVQQFGYGVVRDLTGHGVGYQVHEPPSIPNYDDPALEKSKFLEGMTIAIEPMIIMGGDSRVKFLEDGWTVVSLDGSPAAHFEVTVAVTKDGYELVTPWVV